MTRSAKILVVDDEQIMRDGCTRILSKQDWEVVTAETGEAGLEAIKKGDEIVTNGGLIGRVTAVTGDSLTVEISEKVRVRVMRSHVDRPMSATGDKK